MLEDVERLEVLERNNLHITNIGFIDKQRAEHTQIFNYLLKVFIYTDDANKANHLLHEIPVLSPFRFGNTVTPETRIHITLIRDAIINLDYTPTKLPGGNIGRHDNIGPDGYILKNYMMDSSDYDPSLKKKTGYTDEYVSMKDMLKKLRSYKNFVEQTREN